jgi:adenosyl cobinamide kinase/adenosyl cobinamide phosphate guanylyltransferase
MRDKSNQFPDSPLPIAPDQLPSWIAPLHKSTNHSVYLSQVRDVSRQRLDDSLSNQADYFILRRTLTAAPLLGVLLTAFGFLLADSNIADISSLATPLVGGVAVGAILALINLFLLYLVEKELEQTRLTLQNDIDDKWSVLVGKTADPQHAVIGAVHKLEVVTEMLRIALGNFPSNMKALTQKFESIHETSVHVYSALSEFTQVLRDSTENWSASTASMKKSIDSDLIPSFDTISATSKALEQSATHITSASGNIDSILKGLGTASTEQQKLQTSIIETAGKQIEKQQELFSNGFKQVEDLQKAVLTSAIESMTLLVTELGKQLTPYLETIATGTVKIHAPLKETTEFLAMTSPALKNSAEILTTVSKAASDFSNVITNEIMPSYKSLREFNGYAGQMEQSVTRLTSVLDRFVDSAKVSESMAELLQRRALPTVEVLQRATGSFEDSANTLAECTHELGEVLNLLNRQVTRGSNIP